MAFYENHARKQVTLRYKIKMSGFHHGLLGVNAFMLGVKQPKPTQVKEPTLSCNQVKFPGFRLRDYYDFADWSD